MMPAVDNPLSLASALFGAVCLATWPLFRTRLAMLWVQLGIGIGFGLHYALLGATTAAMANVLGSVQIAVSILVGTSPRLRWTGYLFIPVMLFLPLVTWDGVTSLFAAIGTVVLAVGRMQSQEQKLRLLVLAGTLFWLVHDVLLFSPIAVVDALSFASGLYCYLREELRRGHGTGVAVVSRSHRSLSLSRYRTL